MATLFLRTSLSIGLSFGLLLNDLPTPSFIIDTDILQCSGANGRLPRLFLSQYNVYVQPEPISKTWNDQHQPDTMSFPSMKERAVGYLHAKVIRTKLEDDTLVKTSFLAELDLLPSMCGEQRFAYANSECMARLVQGLNNHHVGSYYWARAAGLGCSMMAIGVQYGDVENDRGILQWEHESGPIRCNSNDGKRSEWVNFLKVGDTVQLVPSYGQEALMKFLTMYSNRVYGVQIKGRPLGSEPLVVCEWKIRD